MTTLLKNKVTLSTEDTELFCRVPFIQLSQRLSFFNQYTCVGLSTVKLKVLFLEKDKLLQLFFL